MFYFNFIAIYLLLGRCSPQVHCLVTTLFPFSVVTLFVN